MYSIVTFVMHIIKLLNQTELNDIYCHKDNKVVDRLYCISLSLLHNSLQCPENKTTQCNVARPTLWKVCVGRKHN